jgi:hypothetical protein
MTMVRVSSIQSAFRRFRSAEHGTTMVEFAICIALFLLILFAILDFSRLGYQWVSAEKAAQRGVRLAAVRPAICPGVPLIHQRLSIYGPAVYPAGTLCSQDGGICFQPAPSVCRLDGTGVDTAAATEIWNSISPLLPDNFTRNNVQMTYSYDRNLGFVGGPYVPWIEMRLVGSTLDSANNCQGNPCFEFVTPLSSLAGAAAASGTADMPNEGSKIPMPGVSATLPAEDMNQGVQG